MADVSWVTPAAGVGGFALALVGHFIVIGRSVQTKDDCEKKCAADKAEWDRRCAGFVQHAEMEKAIMQSAQTTRHDLRNELSPVLLRHEGRIVDVERAVALFTDRSEGQTRKLGGMDDKLDRLLGALPALEARIKALEEDR